MPTIVVNLALFVIVLSIASGCRRSETGGSLPLVVAFGDSLTEGLGVTDSDNYPSRLQKIIDAHGYRYRVVNAGASGETSVQGLKRIDKICALRPGIVIVEFGANDGLRKVPVEVVRNNLSEMVSRLHAAGAKVVLAGMKLPPYLGAGYVEDFHEVFLEVAKDSNVPLIPFFLEGVGGKASLNQTDGLHPNGKGYDVVADNVWKVLKPLL